MASDSSSVFSGKTLVQTDSNSDVSLRDTRSTFQRALDDYIQGLPEKKQKRKFILMCVSLGTSATPETINEAIQKAEEKKTSKRSIRNIISPVINALKDYIGIVDLLASVDPTPSALLWGALRVIIEGAQRYINLFDTIKSELRSLAAEIQRITEYEDLYGESESMQALFYDSYINMLRFWSRVDRECDRCYFSSICRAATSFSTKKLDEIIKDLKDDADRIEETAALVEARLAKGEREETRQERQEAVLERAKAQAERQAASKWRAEQQADRQVDRYRQISEWLRTKYSNESNFNRHQANHTRWLPGTCEWLQQHHYYGAWVDGSLKPPIIWIRAPPGYGKSVLCSFAVRSVQAKAAVAYHFCQFDQPYTAIEILRLIGNQLFEAYWKSVEKVDEQMFLLTQQSSCTLDHVKTLLNLLVKRLSLVYIFVDGLDEEQDLQRWSEVSIVIDYLNGLATEFSDTVRVWYSSQTRTYIIEKLSPFHIVDIQIHASPDVTLFLSRAIPELDELGDTGSGLIDTLVNRADGNFLWANLMVKALREEVNTLREMRKFVEAGLPTELDGYYQRIFDRIERPQRALACKVFSLLAYARRRLTIGEIREAIGLLQSKSPANPAIDDMPFIPRLLKVFAPLIDVDEKTQDPNDRTCHITHSSVLDFLLRRPHVLGPNLRISPSAIADACILYLRQARYSQLLTRQGPRWFDAAGQPVDQHQFILYAAKYWDKHMEQVPSTPALAKAVDGFLTSTNFQTCIQVQCLWVEGKFGVFTVRGLPDGYTFLLRVFPRWFVQGSAEARKKWRDYRQFVHQWRSFLNCSSCGVPKCEVLASPGEVDRCWWPILGSDNFLSKMPCRYTTFCFKADSEDTRGGQTSEGISLDGNKIKILRLKSRTEDAFAFTCEHWELDGNSLPRLLNQQQIIVKDTPINWLSYSKPCAQDAKELVGKAPLAAFGEDCRALRIGAHIYALDNDNEYLPILQPGTDSYPCYIEEFGVRGELVAVASRRDFTSEAIHQSGLRNRVVERFGLDFTQLEIRSQEMNEEPEDTSLYSDADSSSESTSSQYDESSSSSNEAYESWSENSTVFSEDFGFEDDTMLPAGRPMDDTESELDSDRASESSSSGSDQSELPAHAVVGYGRWDSDDDYYWDDLSDGEYPIYAPIAHEREPQIHINIFHSQRRMFHLSLPLRFMLFDSSPAIHPMKPLVVWPLGGGDVLFVDALSNSYFTRRIRPSTTYTRHIFMKCHFSACGQYLHIVALEGQRKPAKTKKPRIQALKLALLVATYRLSSRKTTRSPPTLIHRTRVDLGSTHSLNVSSLPFSLTWTPDYLYFAASKRSLNVHRIRLLPEGSEGLPSTAVDRNAVLVPKKPIFLPDSASERRVHFFPGNSDSQARIIIGGETRQSAVYMSNQTEMLHVIDTPSRRDVKGLEGMLSPPVGCYVDEQTDLGGWVRSGDRLQVPDDMGIGKLDRRREKFDYEDDCDLEPYIF
ncbi:hypothetical protein VNI00_006851 [Paramarasmius palmivorus]|uniref:NACHT domain-containing protein n=1 Tax=Paramarasmius palmivorus TaxID=297713 RepID=A0AAW0D6U1_9AGAR